jgi:hypothetical protein
MSVALKGMFKPTDGSVGAVGLSSLLQAEQSTTRRTRRQL